MPAVTPTHRLALALLHLCAACAVLTGAAAAQRDRIETRSYHFAAADKDMEYALFVPRSYAADRPMPLVVLLHGLGSNPRQVMGYQGITKEAEERGYLVVAPYGYNERGWYGSRGKGKKGTLFGNASDPDNLGELSQQDVFNVLGIVRKEFAIDPDRVYLMGHSMGGAGAIHLGTTHPDLWAALAPLAPALDRRVQRLDEMRHMPIIMASGDKDRLVPVANVRLWVKGMKDRSMVYDYREIEGGDHVRAIASNPELIAAVFDFFDAHPRKQQPVRESDAPATEEPGQPRTPARGAGAPAGTSGGTTGGTSGETTGGTAEATTPRPQLPQREPEPARREAG